MKTINLDETPTSVYRLQLHAEFPLKSAIAILPYLKELGIEGIYCSPIFESASPHGYDVTNPNRLNPALGTIEEYEEFCSLLKQNGMKQVLDVIPNHMGIKGKGNHWWLDVLENGPSSPYALFFDMNWTPEKLALKNKILLPILGDSYGKVLEAQELILVWEEGFWVLYSDYQLPITPSTYHLIFDCPAFSLPSLSEVEKKDWFECLAISKELKRIEEEEKDKIDKQSEKKKQLAALYQRSEFVRASIEKILILFNGKKGESKTFDILHDLLEHQFYRLAHWLVAGQEINYRRFFNINELAAIRIEKEQVLNAHHRWVFELLESKKVQGLRIDHPDGLYDPAQYFERIQAKNPAFVLVEKVLDFKEKLPEHWKVDGTVGYAFLNYLNGLFVQSKNEKIVTRLYKSFIGHPIDFRDLLYERKKRFIPLNLASEINFLASMLEQLTEKSRYYRDFTRLDLMRAMQEIISCFPVYRTYVKPGREVAKRDRDYVTQAIDMAKQKSPEIAPSIYQFLQGLLLHEIEYQEEENEIAMDFLQRFQQLEGPVMAKGLEDSAFFVYNRLISLNEVGGNPRYFGVTKAEFHQFNLDRRAKWPLGFLASSTHDTKYSEDARLRLDVLSEMPSQWKEAVKAWKKNNKKYKTLIRGEYYPDFNTEYYIYQLLLGLWPASETEATSPAFKERLWQILTKIVCEADIHTSWRLRNEPYEKAVKDFLFAILSPHEENKFYPSFLGFQKEIARFGRWNSLSSLLIKIGSVGIVDIYQGNDTWNFCAVDPDNRRPVDYAGRKSMLATLAQAGNGKLQDDGMKLFITARALNFRKAHKDLFLLGEYIPLQAQKEKADNVIAVMRKHNDQVAIFLTGCFFTALVAGDEELPLGEKCWGSTELQLPKGLENQQFTDILTGDKILVQNKEKQSSISLAEAFQKYPFALLTNVANL